MQSVWITSSTLYRLQMCIRDRLYDTYVIEELKCDSNAGFKLIPAFEVVVSRNKVTMDLGTLTDEYEKEITIHTTDVYKRQTMPS